MILYHGSGVEVPHPDVLHSRPDVDFGRGFYVTPLREQAVSWCRRFKRRAGQGVVSVYELDERAFAELNTLRFDTYSEEWLDFVLKCRRGDDDTAFDIVSGGVANDRVFNTVELYFDGLIDKGEAIRRLRYEKPNWQVCLRTQRAIDGYLRFEGSERV